MPVRLALLLPHKPVRHITLDPGEKYLIGRAPDCDLPIDDSRLSRHHAVISEEDGVWSIVDLGSKNGVMVDGAVVERALLSPPNWLSLGGVMGRLESVTEQSLRDEEERARRLWATTLEMRRGLDPAMGLKALLDKTLENVLSLTSLKRGFVLLTDGEGDMRLAACKGLRARDMDGSDFKGSWGAVHLSLSEGELLVSNDTAANPGLGDRPSIVSGGIASLVCVPLVTEGRITGLVYADATERGREFSALDVELLQSLCSQAAIAVGVARLGEELQAVRERLEAGESDSDGISRLLRDRVPAYRARGSESDLARTALAEAEP